METIMILRCSQCGHEWKECLGTPMRVEAFLAHMKGMNVCPQCAHKGDLMVLGREYAEALVRLQEKETSRLEVPDGDRGDSPGAPNGA